MNLFFALKIRTRLLILIFLAIAGMGVVSSLQLYAQRQDMFNERMVLVKTQTESAAGLINHFNELSQKGQMSDIDAQKAAIAALRNVRYNKSEYFFIFDTQYVYKLLPGKPEIEGLNKADLQDSNGKFIIKEMVREAQKGGGFVDYYFAKIGSNSPEPKISYAMLIPNWNWVVGTGMYVDDLNQEFKNNLIWGLAQLLLITVLLSVVAWQITQSILRQLGGEPTKAISIMRNMADGNLQTDISQAVPGSVLATLSEMSFGLRKMISQIRNNAEQLSNQAIQITDSNKGISQAANRQADATASMAAAMEELTVSINHISDSSEITRTTSVQANSLAQEGVAQVALAKNTMEEIAATVAGATVKIRSLDSKAHEISSIAAVIKDIAGQTNLLALNAAIEAARAGEQGRGFAVVADEVRKLAERTSNATVDITEMLDAVQAETMTIVSVMDKAIPQVNHGVSLSQNVAQSLGCIQMGAESTLNHLSEVTEATREQGIASNSIALKVEEISQMVEETSISIANSAENTQKVSLIAQEVYQSLSRFKI